MTSAQGLPPAEPRQSQIDAGLEDLIARNAAAVAALHAEENERIGRSQRFVERVTLAIGRPLFFYAMLFVIVAWTSGNLLAGRLGATPWDPPPFLWLQGLVALASFTTVVMVLIAQERQVRLADRRSHLDLQVNLLAEQRTAKLIALVEELRRDLPSVRDRADLEAEVLKQPPDPLRALEAVERSIDEQEKR